MDDKSFKCVLLGISEESKAYRLYDPMSKRIVVSRDVVFEENECWNWGKSNEEVRHNVLKWGDNFEEGGELDQIEEEAEEEAVVEEVDVNTPLSESHGENSHTSRESSTSSLRGRNKSVPLWMQDYVSGAEFSEEEVENNLFFFSSTSDPKYL